MGISKTGLNLGILLASGHAGLLLVTIAIVYKSTAPWTDGTVKVLIWTVFSLALVFNIGFPLVLARSLNIPAMMVYAIVFPYLFWLNSQAAKCSASQGPPPITTTEGSSQAGRVARSRPGLALS